MILSTSAIVLSLLAQDPMQPKTLERLSKEVLETLIMPPSETSNLFNSITFNVPNPSSSLRIKEAISIQRTILTSLATIRNETALQQALTNSLATKEAEDLKRATERSNLTKLEEDNLRIAIANSLITKEEEDINRAIELSNLTKTEEDKLRLENNNSLETITSSVTSDPNLTIQQATEFTRKLEQNTVTEEPVIVPEVTLTAPQTTQNEAAEEPIIIPQTTEVAPQLEQNTVAEEPVTVPEVTLTAPQTTQNEAAEEPIIIPQTTEVAPQLEQNTVAEEPVTVPEVTLTAPQAAQNEAAEEQIIVPQTAPAVPQPEQNESFAEPAAIPVAPIPPAPPMKLLNKSSAPKLEKAKPSQKSGALQKTESPNNLLGVLLQSKIAPQKEESRKEVTLRKETLLEALKRHQDEIGLSNDDLQLLEAQSLETLKPIINEFYNEENKEWNFGFADQRTIMSHLAVGPKEEEKVQTKSIGKLNIQKNETNLSTAIREARGSLKNEETIVSSELVNVLQDSAKIVSASKATDIPQAPSAPKVLSSKAQDTLVKLKKNKEASKSDIGMTFLEQIANKDTLVKLKAPAPKTSELKNESPKSLNDVLAGSLANRRKSMEIDDESSDDEAWD